MRDYTSIISDLMIWIDDNIDSPIFVSEIAEKSGYSKWHLQRIFRDTTGERLGTYLRNRRLTYAALSLRMTSKPIAEISVQYQFDSQQSFTRTFKARFKMPPGIYRSKEYWDPAGLATAIDFQKAPLQLPEPEFVRFPKQIVWGITYKNNCSLNELLQQNAIVRRQFLGDYLGKYFQQKNTLPSKIYTFAKAVNTPLNLDEQQILYTVGIEKKGLVSGASEYISDGGLYLSFKYVGPTKGFLNFISQIYFSALPRLNVYIRQADIIEVHHNRNLVNSMNDIANVSCIECDYCVPVTLKS